MAPTDKTPSAGSEGTPPTKQPNLGDTVPLLSAAEYVARTGHGLIAFPMRNAVSDRSAPDLSPTPEEAATLAMYEAREGRPLTPQERNNIVIQMREIGPL